MEERAEHTSGCGDAGVTVKVVGGGEVDGDGVGNEICTTLIVEKLTPK